MMHKTSNGKLWDIAEREYLFWKTYRWVFEDSIDLATIIRAILSHYPHNLQKWMFDQVWERIETLWLQDVKEGRV